MENDSKERLLQTAIPLFAAHGFDKVSIRQLAEAAGVNSALISYYFGSKQGLYQAAIDCQVKALVRFTDQVEQKKLTPPEVLRLYAATMLQIHTENPWFIKLCYREFIAPSAILDAFAQKHLRKIFASLAKSMQEGVASGIFRADLDIDAAVVLWAGMVNFFFFSRPIRSRLKNENELPAQAYLAQTLDIFLEGIKRREEA